MIKMCSKSTKELNQSNSKDVEHEDRHADFSHLPTLVLWMIKDRLDFVNNRCFASVCNSWRDATLSYSNDVTLCGESPPWLLIKDLKCKYKCDFINISTGKRYTLFRYYLYRSETLFTKQGWFLLSTKKRTSNMYKLCCGLWPNNDTELGRRLYLFNPFTRKKIGLPDGFSWLLEYCCGAFTLIDGKPDLVAFAGLDTRDQKGPCVRLWTTRVSDHNILWTEHTFKIPPSWYYFHPRSVVIIGQNIYIVCMTIITSTLLVFNLSSCKWSWSRGRQPFLRANYVYIDANKGVVWNACHHRPAASAAAMFRLNDDSRKWEKLKVEEVMNKCWFVTYSGNYDNGYAVSEYTDDAILNDLVESGYLEVINLPYHDEDDPNTVTKIIMYMIRFGRTNAEWVDMPSN